MKKMKITDKKLAFLGRIIDNLVVPVVFIFGIGVGYLFTPGLDLEKAFSQILSCFNGCFCMVGVLAFAYLIITVERIFLILRGKENERKSDN